MKYKIIARWGLSIGLICFGLLYLNSAAFSSWVSWGPPTEYPRVWEQRALRHLGYGISLLSTGIMAFVMLKEGFRWRKSKYKYIWFVLMLLCLTYPKVREWVIIDKCLDSGGT